MEMLRLIAEGFTDGLRLTVRLFVAPRAAISEFMHHEHGSHPRSTGREHSQEHISAH